MEEIPLSPRRQNVKWHFTVTVLALGSLLTSCTLSTSASPPKVSATSLTLPVIFNGVGISIPIGFKVTRFTGCLLQSGEAIVGNPSLISGACSYGTNYSWPGPDPVVSPPTGIIMSTSNYVVAANGSKWPIQATVDGMMLRESAPVVSQPCAGQNCQYISQLYVDIPSHNVGLVFESSGTPSEGSLALSKLVIMSMHQTAHQP